MSWMDSLKMKKQKSIGIPSSEEGHDVKWKSRSANFASWLLLGHLGELWFSWLGEGTSDWFCLVHGRWKNRNPLQFHLVRQTMMWHVSPHFASCFLLIASSIGIIFPSKVWMLLLAVLMLSRGQSGVYILLRSTLVSILILLETVLFGLSDSTL